MLISTKPKTLPPQYLYEVTFKLALLKRFLDYYLPLKRLFILRGAYQKKQIRRASIMKHWAKKIRTKQIKEKKPLVDNYYLTTLIFNKKILDMGGVLKQNKVYRVDRF